jgi:cytosine deaminase
MNEDEIRILVLQRLTHLNPSTQPVANWRTYLLDYEPDPQYPDDKYAWLSCALALQGIATSNFGVGALLVDGGRILAQGHNEIFIPRFRSDRHAEMVVMDDWENSAAALVDGALYTSVEPCPMCVVRLSSSAVRRVLYVAPDLSGGMVRRIDGLPPFWVQMAECKEFGQARCSSALIRAASDIFLLNLDELTERIKAM